MSKVPKNSFNPPSPPSSPKSNHPPKKSLAFGVAEQANGTWISYRYVLEGDRVIARDVVYPAHQDCSANHDAILIAVENAWHEWKVKE